MFKHRSLSVIAAALFVLSAGAFAKVVDKTVAIVNGEPILASEYNSTIAPVLEQWKRATPEKDQTDIKFKELKKNLLDMMVDNKLLKQEAIKRKIKVTPREIDEQMKQFKEGYKTEAEFQDELRKENLTQPQFENKIKEELMAMKLARQEVGDSVQSPGEDQTRMLYKQIMDKMDGKDLGLDKKGEAEIEQLAKIMKQMSSELVKVRHILVQVAKDAGMSEKLMAQKQIEKIQAELKKGGDFEELAKKYSDDNYTKENGGQVGYITKDDERYPKEFVSAALGLNVGQVSKPVLSDFGWHLIKVDEKKAARKVPYEEVANDLKGILFKKAQQAKYEEWVKGLRTKATIKLNPIE